MKRIIGLLGLVILGLNMNAQQMVSGMVIQESKKATFTPVVFANVYWLGTQVGTSTDTNGYFEIPISTSLRSNF